MLQNNLLQKVSQDQMCTAIGVKVVTSNEIILLARAAGYDSVFIDLEHSVMSIEDASRLCSTSLLSGITPFVRVPYECGSGFVQRVLDGGAMGIVFPHISTPEEARRAVSMTKYPPNGQRSLTAALPQFDFRRIAAKEMIPQVNAVGSTVFVQVETKMCLENIDAIAAVEGVEVLLLGANDLSLELSILGEWEHPRFRDALKLVAAAARKSGKVFGIAGLYSRPDICRHAVRDLGARYVLGHLDIGLLAIAMNKNVEQLRSLDTKP
ncbi:Pyruvate/Phosphoenolpyruvate kinase [Hypoxylon trugodes]|uniref:Pyruvate/Phosphoenolpyruvate kinase n=1 Tax=Hypoxylon trugodes TaxID=326681 RepID=UPI0021A05DD2|nr:Pyruvate/Phosphoenolpyruvate kinase [Hypoxylon trugodes]KAI1392698.1 Pyruvate/Phosphoenolpyruvate kinase [Hypoxylon trugodes]